MNYTDKNTTIGGVVAQLPEASQIFSDFGIDYCCGGNRKLSDVVKEQNINGKELYDRLQKAQEERKSSYQGQENGFTQMSSADLTAYIEDVHHGYLRQALPRAAELLTNVLRVHGKNHRELFEVYRLFGALKSDLEQHLLKEETIVFPALTDKNRDEILGLVAEIIKEHEAAGAVLSELRRITNNYTMPADGCSTFEKAYKKLEEIEVDLHQHIHLENNILFREYDGRK